MNNSDDLETIIDFVLIKYSNPNDREYVMKVVNPKKRKISENINEVYAEKVKNLFDCAASLLSKEQDALFSYNGKNH